MSLYGPSPIGDLAYDHISVYREFEARGFSSEIVPLLKKLGLGIAAGAGTTALGDAVSGGDSPSSRRDLTYVLHLRQECMIYQPFYLSSDFEARGLGSEIVPLLKKLGLGIAAGAGTTALGDALGGSDSSSAAAPAATPASRRELTYVHHIISARRYPLACTRC